MKYIKPEIEEIKLLSSYIILTESQVDPFGPWGGEGESEEPFPEVPVPWGDDENGDINIF